MPDLHVRYNIIAQAVALLIYEQRICMSRSSKYATVIGIKVSASRSSDRTEYFISLTL